MSTLNIQATIQNQDTQETHGLQLLSVTTTGNLEDGGRVSVGTSEKTITISSDVGNAGYAILINRDSTNYIRWGYATGDYKNRIRPGHVALLELEPATATLYAIADTAACEMSYKIFEE